MNKRELRIGNYVKPLVGELEHVMCVEWIGWKIGGDLIDENYEEFLSSFQELKHEDVEPIYLTEEWLLKFGFEDACNGFNDYCNDRFTICVEKVNGETIITMYIADCVINTIKYVHQLQNLYFALTGEELTIKN